MDREEVAEARYELVISVDARRSGAYDDVDRTHMRARIYRILEGAFAEARVARDALHLEDRGDGVLVSVAGRIPVTRLLGPWMVEVSERLREENRSLRVPLGLRVGMHVGPVRHDERGISGRAVDLACRLADASLARDVLDAERADLVLVVSGSLYEDVVSSGGRFIEPERYAEGRLEVKEGTVTAWLHLPGRAAPVVPPTRPPHSGTPPTGTPDGPGPDNSPPTQPDPHTAAAAPVSPPPAPAGGGSGAQHIVHGDHNESSGNVYHAPVHIGRRVTGDAGPGRD